VAKDIFEKADEQVAESIRRLTRATSAMAEAIDEGVGVIKHAVKKSGDVAEEVMDDTTQRVKRHPVESMAATFAAGILVGAMLGWMVSRR
jgi:F0F1-type ATP synthase assembly protein I